MSDAPRWLAVVPAAGSSERMMGLDKVLAPMSDRPVLVVTLETLRKAGVDRIAVGVRPAVQQQVMAALSAFGWDDTTVQLVPGGTTRQETVAHCLAAAPETEYVLVHDAARPFCTPALVRRVMEATLRHGAAIAAVPLVDTVHTVADGWIVATPDRTSLYRAQTPQGFSRRLLGTAHRHAALRGFSATDDAQLVVQAGGAVAVVPGEESNRKITVASDLPDPSGGISVGWGTDIHRMVPGRPLILGGVHIPYPSGLLGHSDADVLCHAFADAVLGASGLGDIGQHFPVDDPAFDGADSIELLGQAVALAAGAGWRCVRGDSSVVLEQPRLSRYIPAMRQRLGSALGVAPNAVNVKAGSNEGLGEIGRGHGVEAHAVVVLQRIYALQG